LFGRRAEPIALQLMAERGLDIHRHIATSLNLQHVRAAQLVLTMTLAQRKAVETTYSFAKGKVYRLNEHDGVDVTDPYLQPRSVYEKSLEQIERGIANWLHAMQPHAELQRRLVT
jgi:protein-tyrosine phosphatase